MASYIETRSQPDEQLAMIADQTRRRLLVTLLDDTPEDTPIKITDRAGGGGTADRIQLHHVHLPKLADAGYIRWDQEDHIVQQGPQFDAIEPLLTLLCDHADELPDEWL